MARCLWTKRCFDVCLSAVILLVASPVLLATALAIRITMGRPVLFAQVRPGKHEKPFKLYKFRSMTDAKGPDGSLLPPGQRLTPVGRIIRKTSLDELPQLWNVLKGEMSLVGPRPLLMEYLARYAPEQHRRHEAIPGITGWAQVNGRQLLRASERIRLDVWYVDHGSFALDLKILAMTAWQVAFGRGVSLEQNFAEVDDLAPVPEDKPERRIR